MLLKAVSYLDSQSTLHMWTPHFWRKISIDSKELSSSHNVGDFNILRDENVLLNDKRSAPPIWRIYSRRNKGSGVAWRDILVIAL